MISCYSLTTSFMEGNDKDDEKKAAEEKEAADKAAADKK